MTDTPTISKGMVDHALEYARRDIPVFPCRRKDKAPLTKHGFKDATCKLAQIRAWWDTWPSAMIGVPTGAASGIDVVDLDVKPDEFIDGRKHLPNWKDLSCTVVTTPRGGAHVYFQSDGSVRNTTDRIAPGIDTRGKGGYIIVPPSHNSTGEYRFKKGGMFDKLPAFPSDLLEKLGPRYDGVGGEEPEADPERVSTAMAVIPNADVGWGDWKKFGLAIYRATSGTGFKIFDEWSKKSAKYDEGYTRTEWEGIRGSPPDRIGAGTIFYHADLADTKWWRKGDRLVLDLNAPLDSAKEFVRRCYTRNDTGTLRYYRGAFYEWSRDGSHYEECNNDHLRSRLYQFLEQAITIKGKPFSPSAHKVNQIWDALQSGVEVNAKRNPPFLIDEDEDTRSELGGHIACRNGLLDPITRTLTPHHPGFFNVNSLPFDYDAKAPAYPEIWMKFLCELFPGKEGSDGERAELCLQEVFGLMLTPDTRFQKIFMMIGPRRSGKGTIAKILTKLLGKENVANPTLASLASHFGLQALIDKRCAIIGDARLGPQTNVHTVAERLLSISGEDALTIDRKYKDAWTGQLQVRFLILSNELPGFTDASGALSSRFILLTLQKNFFGKEDLVLADKLMKELPSILNWALRGLKRLRERGHFLMPELSLDAIRQLEDLASPVGAFLRDWCTTEKAKAKVLVHNLYDAYTIWCDVEGHKPKSNAWFGRDLRAKFPGLKSRGRGHDKFYEGIDLSAHGQERYQVLGKMRTPDKKIR
jgi:putative DNA primase/helicase